MRTRWWIVIFALVLAASAAASYFVMRGGASGTAGVYLDGELLRTVDLGKAAEPYEFTVESQYGENTVRVEDGKVYIISSDCHGQECVSHAPLPDSGTPIVCLPHRLVIRMTSGGAEYDAITGTAAAS